MILRCDSSGVFPLRDGCVQCVVTSPPYWGLRDYGVVGQLGLERSPVVYVGRMVGVFREVWRVLKADGVCWLNLGDCYATGAGKVGECPGGGEQGARWKGDMAGGQRGSRGGSSKQPHTGAAVGPLVQPNRMPLEGLKPKDLVGIPWRVALALQADGWWLRSDVVWAKPNPMPESVLDRPTRSHEYVFMLTKGERYFYDADAIREPGTGFRHDSVEVRKARAAASNKCAPGEKVNGIRGVDKQRGHGRRHDGFNDRWDLRTKEEQGAMGRNKRSVWTIAPAAQPEAHFATFPEGIPEVCILASSRVNDVVLDPFVGSGTVERVAHRLGRRGVGLELNPVYCAMARDLGWQAARQGQFASSFAGAASED